MVSTKPAAGQANFYHAKSSKDKALEYYRDAQSIFETVGNEKARATVLNNLSQIYHESGQFDEALRLLKESSSIHRRLGDVAGRASNIENIAGIHKDRGEYGKALASLRSSLAIRERLGDQPGIAKTLCNLGLIYQIEQHYQDAMTFFTKSLEICERIGEMTLKGTVLVNMAVIEYHRVLQYHSDDKRAFELGQASLTIHKKLKDSGGIAKSLQIIGDLYQRRRESETALNYYREARELWEGRKAKSTKSTIPSDWNQFKHPESIYSFRYPDRWVKRSPVSGVTSFEAVNDNPPVLCEVIAHRMGKGVAGDAVDYFINAMVEGYKSGQLINQTWHHPRVVREGPFELEPVIEEDLIRPSGSLKRPTRCFLLTLEYEEGVNMVMAPFFFMGRDRVGLNLNFKVESSNYRKMAETFQLVARSMLIGT